MTEQAVIRILGALPPDFQCEQRAYAVGFEGVTRIERREENLGTYGIVWFDAFADDRLVASMNAIFLSEVEYNRAA